ncbi:hypothetical protein WJX75_002770 [Coccomyxa subellipsoidea]|uniref:Uracil-DNA glycosylase-like domain-containing protein n=1 Tax=Coccomyxa subellipsoidea TaxID=248742 RepID=A0ABR2YDN7_9CHLO
MYSRHSSADQEGQQGKGKQKIPLENAKGLPERLGDMPLRLIVGGNNPSDHAWSTGHYYSHPANWMWRILKKTGIAPAWVKGPQDDERMVTEAGVGFLDVGCGHPGTLLSEFSSQTFQSWAPAFYARLEAHMERAAKNAGCVCGECGAPAVVGFAGKRQWMELLNVGRKGREKYTKLEHGLQPMRPDGWPFPASTEVWVLPSTSGAAPMATADRVGPWQELSDRIKLIDWPRKLQCVPEG